MSNKHNIISGCRKITPKTKTDTLTVSFSVSFGGVKMAIFQHNIRRLCTKASEYHHSSLPLLLET